MKGRSVIIYMLVGFLGFMMFPSIVWGRTTLRLSFWFHAEDLPYWQKGIDRFKASHPEVDIQIESTPFGDYWQKLQTQVAAGTVPDIIGMVSMYAPQYIKQGVLMNLSPYIKQENFDIKDFWPQIMRSYKDKKGNIYAFPYDLSTMAILGNVDMFSQVGFKFPPSKWTWDDFLNAAKKLTKKDSSGKIIQWGIGWFPYEWVLDYILLPNGASMFNKEVTKCLLDTPAAIESLQKWADLYLKYGVAISPTDASGNVPFFESGKIAMVGANPEWVMVRRIRMPNIKLDVAPFPYTRNPLIGALHGGSFSISATTKYPQLAWEFLKEFTSASTLKESVAMAFRGIPGRQSLVGDFLESPNGVPNAKLFLDLIKVSRVYPLTNYDQTMTVLKNNLDKIYLGKALASQVCPEMAKEIDKLLEPLP